MTYLPTMGATDMVVPSFNTTKYPGTCKPANAPTLELVYELQRQLNRVAQMRKLTKIAVDGDIGPGTVKLFNAALGTSADCTTIGSQVRAFTAQLGVLAATLGAPAKVPAPAPAKPSTFVDPTTNLDVIAPKGIAASLSDSIGLSTPMIAALGVAAVGVGYYVYKRKAK